MDRNEQGHIDFEQVARYLSKEMSAKEKADFELQIEQNAILAKEVEAHKNIWAAAESKTVFNTDAAWNKLDAKIQTSKKHSKPKQSKWILRVAASVVIVFSFYWFFSEKSPKMIQISSTEQGIYEMPDGSIVKSNAGAEISYASEFKGAAREVTLKGEAFFDVVRNPNKPFIVKTDFGTIQVLGTEFNVKTTEDGALRVAVKEGKVQVTSINKEQLILIAGESAVFDNDTKSLIKKAESYDLFWINKTLRFRDTRLEMVFDILEKNYDINIDVKDNEILNCTYTGTFKDTPIDSVFHFINNASRNLVISNNGKSYEISGTCTN